MWLASLVVVLCAVMTVSAAKLDKGTQELSVSGSAQDLDELQYEINVGYGYFIAPGLKFGGVVGYEAQDKDSALRAGADVEYNFVGDSALVPFVGAGLSLAYVMPEEGDSDTSYVITPNAGVKYFVVDNLSIGARVQFHKADTDRYRYDDESKDTKTTIEIDTRFYF